MDWLSLYQRCLEDAPFAVFVFSRDGAVHYCNPQLVTLAPQIIHKNEQGVMRIDSDSPLLKNWSIYTERKSHVIKLASQDQKGNKIQLEGEVLLLPQNAEPLAVFYLADTTELRATYRSLRTALETFRAIFDLAPDVIALTRLRDNIVVQINSAYKKLSGHDPSFIIGRTAIDTGAWEFTGDRDRFISLLRVNKRVDEFHTTVINAEGVRVHVSVSGVIVLINDEAHSILMFRDISKLKEAEIELRELNAELETRVKARTEELSRLNEELESFIFTISHDIRAPIRAISGFSALLREQSHQQLDDDNKSLLKRIESAAARMMNMTDDLLKLSRLSRAEVRWEPISLGSIAEEIVRDLQLSHPARTVQLICQPDLSAVADARLLRQVMENLLGNAWKYTQHNPNAVIEVWADRLPNEGYCYYVKDNGVGFDIQYADRLFHPFSRLHKESEFAGTGVGLASVSRIIGAHGGKVGAYGKLGEGATFWFTLPAAPSRID